MSAQAVIWYYPDPAGGFEKIAFGVEEPMDDVVDLPRRVTAEAEGLGGGTHGVALAGSLDVALLLEQFDDEDLAHQLKSFETHVQRYGVFGFARDEDSAFGAWSIPLPRRGDTTLTHGGHVYWGSPTLAAGDWLVLESPLPEMTREWVKVSSTSGNVITLDSSTPVVYTYAVGPVLIRERDFFPALIWPREHRRNGLVTHDRRLSWTFDGVFRQDPLNLHATYKVGGTVVRTPDRPNLPTLDGLTNAPVRASRKARLGRI